MRIKQFMTILASVISSGVFVGTSFAQEVGSCNRPSSTVNYVPLGVNAEFCVEGEIENIAATPDLEVIFGSTTNTLILRAVQPNIFTNVIVRQSNGKTVNFNVLTMPRAEVEQVRLLQIED